MADVIRAGVLWGFDALTRSLGYESAPLLAQVGLSEEELDDPDHYILRQPVIALLEHAAVACRCRDFGLRLGEIKDIHTLGALSFAIRNAVNLRDALETAAKYSHFHATRPRLAIVDGDKPSERRILFHMACPRATVCTQMIEHSTSLFCRVFRHITDDAAKPRRITFSHAAVNPPETYRAHLGLEPEFESECDGVVFARHDLELPLKQHDAHLKQMIERYLEANAPEPGHSLERGVRHTIWRNMRDGGQATIRDTADALRIDERTLQRRLEAANTTFESIRDDVRRSLAEDYLAHPHAPISHISDLLGYSTPSAFSRANRRWFDETPRETRQRLLSARKLAEDRGPRRSIN